MSFTFAVLTSPTTGFPVSLKFTDGINIVLGLSNSGKSYILEQIYTLYSLSIYADDERPKLNLSDTEVSTIFEKINKTYLNKVKDGKPLSTTEKFFQYIKNNIECRFPFFILREEDCTLTGKELMDFVELIVQLANGGAQMFIEVSDMNKLRCIVCALQLLKYSKDISWVCTSPVNENEVQNDIFSVDKFDYKNISDKLLDNELKANELCIAACRDVSPTYPA